MLIARWIGLKWRTDQSGFFAAKDELCANRTILGFEYSDTWMARRKSSLYGEKVSVAWHSYCPESIDQRHVHSHIELYHFWRKIKEPFAHPDDISAIKHSTISDDDYENPALLTADPEKCFLWSCDDEFYVDCEINHRSISHGRAIPLYGIWEFPMSFNPTYWSTHILVTITNFQNILHCTYFQIAESFINCKQRQGNVLRNNGAYWCMRKLRFIGRQILWRLQRTVLLIAM